jgi:hypothetical protein
LYIARRTPEPYDSNVNAPDDPVDEWLFKEVEKLTLAYAIHFTHYNFCRVHQTLRITPAMTAGLTDHAWTLAELLTVDSNLICLARIERNCRRLHWTQQFQTTTMLSLSK